MSKKRVSLRNQGFTLLEMLVALSVFSVAITIVMTTLVSIVNLQKKLIAIQTAQDNLRYAFESMAKEIRTGKVFHCGATGTLTASQNCPINSSSGADSFTFRNSVGQTVTYQIYNGQLVKSSDANLPNCANVNTPYINCQYVTSPGVVSINKLNFYVSGSGSGDGAQSMVTIVLEGQVSDTAHNIGTAKLNLQTTMSRRGLIDRP